MLVYIKINIYVLNIEISMFYPHSLTFATLAKELASVSFVIRRGSFLWFFFRHQDGMACGGVRSSCSARRIRRNPFSPWVGGRFPINRLLPALSEQHEPAGKIELSYRFPFARARMWKTCVSPVDDASLLIDGDASKTFKIVRRNRGKESVRGILGGTARRVGLLPSRDRAPPSHMRTIAKTEGKS